MRHVFAILLVVAIITSCTEFKELLPDDTLNLESVTPGKVKTSDHTIAINIELDRGEFDHMYDNYYGEIDVYGTMTLYRNHVAVFESQNTRFRIKGGGSRVYDLKSLGIRFENPVSNVGRNLLNPPQMLPFHSLDNIKSLRLRNSGNDFITSRNATMIKDISYTQLAIVAGLDIDLMYTEQAAVFLNNQFLGVLNLRSESNSRGIGHLYNTTHENVTLAKISPTENGFFVEKQDGDSQRIDNLLQAIENRNINYLKHQVDLDNFIDYVIFQTYIANRDWPHNNVKFFAIGDNKFRFFMFDLDHSNLSHHTRKPLEFLNRSRNNPVGDMFLALYEKDNAFRESFQDRYQYLLAEGYLSSERFREITGTYYKNIEHVMPLHIAKYNHPTAMAEWYRNVELLNVYFKKREQFIKSLMLD